MGMLWVILVFLIVGLCAAKGKSERRRFLGSVAEWLYAPIGTLLSLLHRCK